MDYTQLLNTMVIFAALIGIGYIGARTKLLSAEFSKTASKLVLNVFLSASVINSVLGDPPPLSGGELWYVMLLLTLCILLCYILGGICVLFLKKSSSCAPVEELLMSVPNTMFVGLPIAQELFGAEAVLYIALCCIPFNVAIYTYGIWRLKAAKGLRGSMLQLKELLSIPQLATLISLAIFLIKPPIPAVVAKLFGTLAGATMPMSMIVIGATLGPVSFLDAFKGIRIYFISFVRLLAAPILTWFLLGFFTTNSVLISTCMIIAACPSAVMVTVLALQYDYDPIVSSEGVLATTAISMLTIPLLAWLLV